METHRTVELRIDAPGWESAFTDAIYAYEALRSLDGDDTLEPIARRLAALLADRDAIDDDGFRIRRAVLRAEGHVRLADVQLDATLAKFAARVLELAGGDRASAFYTRFFPDAHENVIDLGLDAEVPVVSLVSRLLDEDPELPAPLREHAPTMRAALQRGMAALVARSDALANAGRHAARVAAWIESAAATKRLLERSLRDIASARGHGDRWVAAILGTAEDRG